MKSSFLAPLFVLVVASAARAQENVIFEVHGKDKVLGTIRPEYESEGFLCSIAQGGVLRASVKSKQRTGPIPTLDVILDGNSAGATVVHKGRGSSILPFTAPTTGVYKVVVRGDGLKDGDYQLKVSFTKTSNRVTDLRDSALAGAFSGGPIVVGAVIDDENGGSVAVQGTYSPLDGSSVDIPPGALGQPTSVFIAEAAVYPLDDGIHPAGPAVEFGPSGTQFPEGKEATVTIPFDLASFPGGTEGLVVYVKDANGDIAAVPGPYTFNDGTVTFVTSHFSTFLATSSGPRGLPPSQMEQIEILGMPQGGYAGFVGVGIGNAGFDDGYYASNFPRGITFSPGVPGQVDPSAVSDSRSEFRSGGLTVVDDSAIQVDLGGPVTLFRRGYRDDLLVLQHVQADELGTTLLVRRTRGAPTLNTLAGRWHVFVWEFEADGFSAVTQTVPMRCRVDVGHATVATTGAVKFSFSRRIERATDYPGGVWTRTETTGGQSTATFFPLSEIGLVLGFDESESFARITSAMDGDLIFAPLYNIDRGFGRASSRTALLVMLRESGRASIRQLAGGYFDAIGGLDLADEASASDPAGVRWHAESANTNIASAKTARISSFYCSSGYNVDAQPVNTSTSLEIPATPFGLSTVGAFSVPTAKVFGAFSRTSDFFVDVQGDDTSVLMGFGLHFSPELILIPEATRTKR